MERELVIGMHIVFIDAHRKERAALLTAIHGDPRGCMMISNRKSAGELTKEERSSGKWELDSHEPPIYAYEVDENGHHVVESREPGEHWPCVNLAVISDNEDAKDQYGRQLDERFTSIVHWEGSSAIGFCFRFADEKVDWSKMQPTIS